MAVMATTESTSHLAFAVMRSPGAWAQSPGSMKAKLMGDGLVPVASALGQHAQPKLSLESAPQRQAVVHNTGHLALLSSTEVYGLLRQWLS